MHAFVLSLKEDTQQYHLISLIVSNEIRRPVILHTFVDRKQTPNKLQLINLLHAEFILKRTTENASIVCEGAVIIRMNRDESMKCESNIVRGCLF